MISQIIAKHFVYEFLWCKLLLKSAYPTIYYHFVILGISLVSNCYNLVILKLHTNFSEVYACIFEVYLLSCFFINFFFSLALRVLFTCTLCLACVWATECLSFFHCTAQKRFSIKDFFSKCKISIFVQYWYHSITALATGVYLLYEVLGVNYCIYRFSISCKYDLRNV